MTGLLNWKDMTRKSHLFVICGLLLYCVSCRSGDGSPERGLNTADRDRADSIVEPGVQDSALFSAAERIIAFLHGDAAYETLSLADTVELLIRRRVGARVIACLVKHCVIGIPGWFRPTARSTHLCLQRTLLR